MSRTLSQPITVKNICLDFFSHLFKSVLLFYPSVLFSFFFIFSVSVLLLHHHLVTSFLSLYQAAVMV